MPGLQKLPEAVETCGVIFGASQALSSFPRAVQWLDRSALAPGLRPCFRAGGSHHVRFWPSGARENSVEGASDSAQQHERAHRPCVGQTRNVFITHVVCNARKQVIEPAQKVMGRIPEDRVFFHAPCR